MECKVIYNGNANPNFEAAPQIQTLADILNCSAEKAAKVRQMKKAVVIKRTDKATAVKLVKMLRAVGLDATAKVDSNDNGASSSSSNEDQVERLQKQVNNLTDEVAQLRSQLLSLSVFVDEHVQKKDIDIDLDDELSELDQLLAADDNDFSAELMAKNNSTDDAELLKVDDKESTLLRILPMLIAVLILLIAGAAAWYFLGE